jgi:hypothetical protein
MAVVVDAASLGTVRNRRDAGIFGFDIYRVLGARWIAVNVAVGIVLTPRVVWLARRFDDRQDGIARGWPTTSRGAACRMR